LISVYWSAIYDGLSGVLWTATIVRELARVTRDDECLDALLSGPVRHFHSGAVRQPAIGDHEIIEPTTEQVAAALDSARGIDLIPSIDSAFVCPSPLACLSPR
jgi:hypothetical protein